MIEMCPKCVRMCPNVSGKMNVSGTKLTLEEKCVRHARKECVRDFSAFLCILFFFSPHGRLEALDLNLFCLDADALHFVKHCVLCPPQPFPGSCWPCVGRSLFLRCLF